MLCHAVIMAPIALPRPGPVCRLTRAAWPVPLGEPFCHPERGRLLQAEHVAEVVGEVLEERQLRRAGVAEDRRHPKPAKEIEGRLADRSHNTPPL